MKTNYFLIIFSLLTFTGYSQNSNEDWVTYIEQKEKGLMVKSVNLNYDYARPNYKNLLIVGTNTRECLKNGYPKDFGLSKFYMFSDSIATIVNSLTKNRLVGVQTYQCSGFDIYYIKDTINVRASIQHFLEYNYILSKNYLMLKTDKKWQHYKEVLFPKNLSDSFFNDHTFLNELVIEGDDLTESRKIEHWIHFRREKGRQVFINEVKKLNFVIDSIKFKKGKSFPYELKISRKDKVLPDSIAELTLVLKKLAVTSYGIYDGWGTEPVIKD